MRFMGRCSAICSGRPALSGLMTNPKSRKKALQDFLAERPIASIGEAEWQSALRDLLRSTGLPFAQPYAGIRQKSFAELEQDLRDMLSVYLEAVRSGDRPR